MRVAEAQNKWVRANRVWRRQARTSPDVQWEIETLTRSAKLLSDIVQEPTWLLTGGLRPGNLVKYNVAAWGTRETLMVFTSAANCSRSVFFRGRFWLLQLIGLLTLSPKLHQPRLGPNRNFVYNPHTCNHWVLSTHCSSKVGMRGSSRVNWKSQEDLGLAYVCVCVCWRDWRGRDSGWGVDLLWRV